jgi:hypothetical protein
VTSLSEQQIRDLLGLFELPDGRIFFINPSVVDSSGRLVGPDTLDGQSFNGQVFFNPGPGEVGSLVVNTVDSLDRIERAVSGAPVVKPRHDTFYGTTEFVCEGAGREPCRLRRDQEAVVGIHGAGS